MGDPTTVVRDYILKLHHNSPNFRGSIGNVICKLLQILNPKLLLAKPYTHFKCLCLVLLVVYQKIVDVKLVLTSHFLDHLLQIEDVLLSINANANANTNDKIYQLSWGIVHEFILLFCIFIQENENINENEYKHHENKLIKCIFKLIMAILDKNLKILNYIRWPKLGTRMIVQRCKQDIEAAGIDPTSLTTQPLQLLKVKVKDKDNHNSDKQRRLTTIVSMSPMSTIYPIILDTKNEYRYSLIEKMIKLIMSLQNKNIISTTRSGNGTVKYHSTFARLDIAWIAIKYFINSKNKFNEAQFEQLFCDSGFIRSMTIIFEKYLNYGVETDPQFTVKNNNHFSFENDSECMLHRYTTDLDEWIDNKSYCQLIAHFLLSMRVMYENPIKSCFPTFVCEIIIDLYCAMIEFEIEQKNIDNVNNNNTCNCKSDQIIETNLMKVLIRLCIYCGVEYEQSMMIATLKIFYNCTKYEKILKHLMCKTSYMKMICDILNEWKRPQNTGFYTAQHVTYMAKIIDWIHSSSIFLDDDNMRQIMSDSFDKYLTIDPQKIFNVLAKHRLWWRQYNNVSCRNVNALELISFYENVESDFDTVITTLTELIVDDRFYIKMPSYNFKGDDCSNEYKYKNMNINTRIVNACEQFVSHMSNMRSLRAPLIFYGFDWFGDNIGNFGILKLLYYDACFIAPKNRECIRIIRTSMKFYGKNVETFFANYKENMNRMLSVPPKSNFDENGNYRKIRFDSITGDDKHNGQWLRALISITGAVYSFQFINFNQFGDNINVSIDKQYQYLIKYLKRNVLHDIELESNLEIIETGIIWEIDHDYMKPLVNDGQFVSDLSNLIIDNNYSDKKLKDRNGIMVRNCQHLLDNCNNLEETNNVFDQIAAMVRNVHLNDIGKVILDKDTITGMKQHVINVFVSLVTNFVEYHNKNGKYKMENYLANENQFNQWSNNVINPSTRDKRLYYKWKNVTQLKMCNFCKKNDRKLKKCKGCRKVCYCCKKCQKSDWNQNKHSNFCC